MKVKAVLFDLGGTLIDSAEIYDTFYRILKMKGVGRPRRDVKMAVLDAERELRKQYSDDVPKDEEYYVRWNLSVLHRLGIYEQDAELAKEIDEHWFDYMEIKPYPGVMHILKTLSDRGVKLAIVTNGYESDLRKILPRLGIGNFINISVAADTIKTRKPDPKVFLYTLKRLHVEPNEAVFVGDEYEIDYVGAERAGLIPFLLRAKGKRANKGVPEGINIIHSLPELLARITV